MRKAAFTEFIQKFGSQFGSALRRRIPRCGTVHGYTRKPDLCILFFIPQIQVQRSEITSLIVQLVDLLFNSCLVLDMFTTADSLSIPPRWGAFTSRSRVSCLEHGRIRIDGNPVNVTPQNKIVAVLINDRLLGDQYFSVLQNPLVEAIPALDRALCVLSSRTLSYLYHVFYFSFVEYKAEIFGLGYARHFVTIL